ncbi:MAG TPA: hypothetical protein VH760_04385 [Gaiellaceae bacterium]
MIVPDTDALIAAARSGGDPELSYVVSGKARPVLLLSDPPSAHHREVAALRLVRLSTLSRAEQEQVRADREELLFHLAPERFDLPEENAVLVTALVRLHVDAIGSGPPAGWLDDGELRVLGERIVRFYGFDVRALVERYVHELAARRAAREPDS